MYPPQYNPNSYFHTGGLSSFNSGYPLHSYGLENSTYVPAGVTYPPQRTYPQPSFAPLHNSALGQDLAPSPTSALTLSTPNDGSYTYSRGMAYPSRPAAADPWNGAYGLRTPTSASDSGIGYQDARNTGHASSQNAGQDVRGSIGQNSMMSLSMPQTQAMANATPTYTMSTNLFQPTPSHRPTAIPANPTYGQPAHLSVSKYEPIDYAATAGPLFDTDPRDALESGGSAFSNAQLPLGGSTLNRSYAPTHPPQQETANAMAAQDLAGYKSDAQAYPTPQQTSPLG